MVVYSKESLDTLQSWVEPRFAGVPNKDLPRCTFAPDPFGPLPTAAAGAASAEQDQCVCKYLEVVPVRDTKSCTLYFPIPAVQHKYRTKPTK